MKCKLKAYMGHGCESREGAVLIFDYTARDAIKQFRHHWLYSELVDEFIDARAVLLNDQEWNLSLAIQDTPHIIDDPISCERCEFWGSRLNAEDCLNNA